MAQLINEIHACHRCELRERCVKPIAGKGLGQLMLVGEHPSWMDDKVNLPFSDRDGDFLNNFLKEAEIHESYLTYLVKCNPGYKGVVEQENINMCKGWLWREIKEVAPKIIVTLGKMPAVTLLGLKKSMSMSDIINQGRIVNWNDKFISVNPWYSMGYVRNNTKKFWESKTFFKKVKELL